MGECKLTECGLTQDGLLVQAITDCAGAQVVVTDPVDEHKDNLLSPPLRDHAAAVELGNQIVREGVNTYNNWQKPISTLGEFVCVISGLNIWGQENGV